MTLFSVKEVASQFGVSSQCIYRMIATGTLRGHRLGLGKGVLRISEEDILKYLALRSTDRPRNRSEGRNGRSKSRGMDSAT